LKAPKEPVIGKCHLCGNIRELQGSHVWPKFAYKQYVSNLKKGGQFIDLHKDEVTSEQYVRPWFCSCCEQLLGRTENRAARICRKLDNDEEVEYDEQFHRFVTSISWRSLKLRYEDEPLGAVRNKWPAFSIWQRYLRESRTGIAPYTQHVFAAPNQPHGMDKGLGGHVIVAEGLVLSQIGPITIVGLLAPDRLTEHEKPTWANSMVRQTGGKITPIKQWVFGDGDAKKLNITTRLAALLKAFEDHRIERLLTGNWGKVT